MKTLLLADDSVTIQRVIELTFAHEDVRVVSVSDGRRALQWMEGDAPDVVLVDVAVPEVDGYAVAAHVKQSARLKDVPVLLLAGAFEPVDQERVRSIGCDGVLVKPFEPQQLVGRVKALFQQASMPRPDIMPSGRAESSLRGHEVESAVVTPFPGSGRAAAAYAAEPEIEPEPLEPPTRPVWETAPAAHAAPERLDPPASRVSLVNAFSALLAAEQSNHAVAAPAPVAPVVSEAMVEEVVRRVLTQMTDETVQRIVLETAERLIRDEIEKIKAQPE